MPLTLRTQHALQALILAGLGIFLLEKFWSGSLFWYINQRFAILTVLAAMGLLALAQSVSRRRAARPPNHEHDLEHGHAQDHEPAAGESGHLHEGHSHGSLSPWALLAVALPVLLGVLIPARPLGSSAMSNKGLNAAAPLAGANGGQPQRLDLAPTDRTVLDWVRAFNYEADPSVFTGQPADVIGFVFHDGRLGENQFFTGRFAVSCCVADAAGIAVVTEWPNSASLPDNTWVRVRGTVQVAQLDGRALPLVIADSVETVPEPEQPYLYP